MTSKRESGSPGSLHWNLP